MYTHITFKDLKDLGYREMAIHLDETQPVSQKEAFFDALFDIMMDVGAELTGFDAAVHASNGVIYITYNAQNITPIVPSRTIDGSS